MALIIYPNTNYDSLVSLSEADSIIEKNSVHSSSWTALSDELKEVYLRIATQNILGSVSTDQYNPAGYLDVLTYVAENSCLPKSCALVAMNDVVYQISAEINPNTGLISKEKVGDIEVSYVHGANTSSKQLSSKNKNIFPSSVHACLASYGAKMSSGGFYQTSLERA